MRQLVNAARPEWPDRSSAAHARRTAEGFATFFSPSLSSGMSLLDVGCGPGSITAGLARLVATGEAIGVDRNAAVLRRAEEGRRASGPDNLRFLQGEATMLPFAGDSFDAVFMHALLQHLPEPALAVSEAARVLKPGGVIGLRDVDHDASMIFPEDSPILRSLHVMTELRERHDTSPRVGKQLRSLLAAAGFEDVTGSALATCDASPERTAVAARDMLSRWQSEAFVESVKEAELATSEEIASFVAAWEDWAIDPSAFWVRVWCEAVGRLPEG